MDDWESLKAKGNAAFQAGDLQQAIEHFTDSIELADDNESFTIYANRSAAYVKQENWVLAVADAEKVVKLQPSWPKGYARLALASFGNQDFIGARRAYSKASELEPDNEQYKNALQMCNLKIKEAASEVSQKEIQADAEKRIPELAAAFADPKNIETLRTHPRTRHFFKDRDFEAKIMEVHKEPSKIKDMMGTQRFTTCIGILMGLNVVPSQVQQAEERDQLTISSDEEDDDDDLSSSDDEEEEGDKKELSDEMPAPISTTNKSKVDREQLRKDVAAKMGVSIEDMDKSLRQLHKSKDEGDSEKEKEEEPSKVSSGADSTEMKMPPQAEGAAVNIEDEPATIELPPVPELEGDRKTLSLEIKDKASKEYSEKKFQCAIKLYSFGHQLDPNNLVFQLNLAAVNLAIHDYQACIIAGEMAATIGAEQEADDILQAKAYARIAKAHGAMQQYDDAIKARKKALELHRCPAHLKALRDTEKEKTTFLEMSIRDPLQAQACKARGNEFFKKGKYPEAIKEYTDAVKRDPDNKKLCSRVFCNRAACYTKMGEMMLAVQDCDRSLDNDAEYVKAFLRKGKVLTMTEQWQEAEFIYVQALDLDPHNFEARMGLEKAQRGMEVKSSTAESRAAKAMNDPKIREMWEDCRQLLKDMQEDPESRAVAKELENPEVRWKLAKLREAGLLG